MEPIRAVTVTLPGLDRFRADVAGLLAADPIGTNVMATVSGSATAASAPGALWIVVRAGAEVVGAAFCTPPYPLNLPAMPEAAVHAVAHALHSRGERVTLLSGEVRVTGAFARCWGELTGATAELTTAMGVHVLGEFAPSSGIAGTMRTATTDDVDLVEAWLLAFDADTHDRAAPHRPDRADLERRLTGGRLLLWSDGGHPVSLAGWHPPRAGVGRVGPVYTPPEHRRHGYAAAVTTAASRAVLSAGAERVMLFTDLSNPTSNGVYARLGYRQVSEASEWKLTPPSP